MSPKVKRRSRADTAMEKTMAKMATHEVVMCTTPDLLRMRANIRPAV